MLLTCSFSPPSRKVWKQEEILKMIQDRRPPVHYFAKQNAIYGYRITEQSIDKLPLLIQEGLGKTDQSEFPDKVLLDNQGSYIALQFTDKEEPDFYVIGKKCAKKCYRLLQKVPPSLELSLPSRFAPLKTEVGNLVCLQKTASIRMVKMSDLGFLIEKEAIIENLYNTQTKPASKDAFLAYSTCYGVYYMVNVDQKNVPINYAPSKKWLLFR